MKSLKPIALALLLLPTLLVADEIEPRPAESAPLADDSLILDVIRAGERWVAVGARGHVLLSHDGREWKQAESVPVRSTLTRVEFAGGRLWAVGHDTTIIYSSDLGETWSLQHFKPMWDAFGERPLLDVHFFDASRGLAVGAFGLLMYTEDAGRTWDVRELGEVLTAEAIDWEQSEESDETGTEATEAAEQDDDPADQFYDAAEDFDRGCYEFVECHLNAILALDDDQVMLAGEQGYGFRSTDGGQSWTAFRFPYPGSIFGLIPANGGVMAFGLRGNVLVTNNFGDDWQALDSGVRSTLLGAAVDPDGYPVIVGNGATVLVFNPHSREFEVSQDRLGSDYAAVSFAEDGSMILVGEDGIRHE